MQRDWQDHPVFRSEKFCERAAWCWLIDKAMWKDTRHNISGTVVIIERGQFCVTLRALGDAWGWNKNVVARFLRRLENETMIETENGTGKTIITICNYSRYQDAVDDGGTGIGTVNGTRVGQEWDKSGTQKKEPKKVKKERTDISTEIFDDKFWPMYPKKADRKKALGKWLVACKTTDPEVMLAGLEAQLPAMRAKIDNDGHMNWIAGGAVWIHNERWLNPVEDIRQPITGIDAALAECVAREAAE